MNARILSARTVGGASLIRTAERFPVPAGRGGLLFQTPARPFAGDSYEVEVDGDIEVQAILAPPGFDTGTWASQNGGFWLDETSGPPLSLVPVWLKAGDGSELEAPCIPWLRLEVVGLAWSVASPLELHRFEIIAEPLLTNTRGGTQLMQKVMLGISALAVATGIGHNPPVPLPLPAREVSGSGYAMLPRGYPVGHHRDRRMGHHLALSVSRPMAPGEVIYAMVISRADDALGSLDHSVLWRYLRRQPST